MPIEMECSEGDIMSLTNVIFVMQAALKHSRKNSPTRNLNANNSLTSKINHKANTAIFSPKTAPQKAKLSWQTQRYTLMTALTSYLPDRT